MFFSEGQKFLHALPVIQQNLPVSPLLFQEVFAASGDDANASLEALGSIMEKDQGLAVKILSMANSAYYGLQSQVSSVRRAVVVLGLKEVRKLLLLMSIRGLQKMLRKGIFDLHFHWKHQVEVGHVVRALARQAVIDDPEELFTAGLFHDLGKMIIAIHEPDHWLAIEKLAKEKQIMLHQAEDLYWGLDHALIGALALKTWFLPASLTEPINWHHNPHLAQEFAPQAMLLRIADALVHGHLQAAFGPGTPEWEQDMEKLHIATHSSIVLAQEVLQGDEPASFLQGLGLRAPDKH